MILFQDPLLRFSWAGIKTLPRWMAILLVNFVYSQQLPRTMAERYYIFFREFIVGEGGQESEDVKWKWFHVHYHQLQMSPIS